MSEERLNESDLAAESCEAASGALIGEPTNVVYTFMQQLERCVACEVSFALRLGSPFPETPHHSQAAKPV